MLVDKRRHYFLRTLRKTTLHTPRCLASHHRPCRKEHHGDFAKVFKPRRAPDVHFPRSSLWVAVLVTRATKPRRFEDTNPDDVVVTPFTSGAGGTIVSKWDLTEGNNTTLTDQLPNILAGRSYINFHTRRLPGGEIRGQIEENPQVISNIHKVFSYGLRNNFGFDFDPKSGNLWLEQNGDDTFSELNLVQPQG